MIQYPIARDIFAWYILDMDHHEIKRSEASRAVIALRNALKKTQQEFAVEVVKTAISTIARWETKDPPKGDALLQLADVASQNNQPNLSMDFELLYFAEVMPRLRNKRIRKPGCPGYVICAFDNSKDAAAAAEFLLNAAEDLAQLAKEEKER
jgi:transcriptional regulator with XRE-family HTH domain